MMVSSASGRPTPPYALLVDVTRCTGCARCTAACAEHHGTDPQKVLLRADELSADSRCAVLRLEGGRFLRKSCMHCVEPSCVSACLVGGLIKTEEGPVVYDPERCIGCRYCMLACPFHVPRYEWEQTFPFMRKCTLCHDRLEEGRPPACVEACPHEALSFGNRAELIERAHQRIAAERSRYVPHVWGEELWGGTSVLYISDVSLEPAGFDDEGHQPIPEATEPVLHATPYIAVSVALTTTGLRWIVQRRQRLMGSSEEERHG